MMNQRKKSHYRIFIVLIIGIIAAGVIIANNKGFEVKTIKKQVILSPQLP